MNARQEAQSLGEARYFGAVCRRKHSGWRYTINADCVECAQLRQSNGKRRAYENAYRQTEKYKTYQQEYQRGYMKTPAYKAQKQAYAKRHPEKLVAKSVRYSASKLNRTPRWLTVDDFWMMEQAYELAKLRTEITGFAWEVDHEIPLRGRLVSGLHVPHNLRVIPKILNRNKSNQFTVS